MKKITSIIAIYFVGLIGVTATAQSIVDPGISTFNYKHPNKAAEAKAKGANKNTVRVASFNTIEKYSKHQKAFVSTTPKYAPRPVALVVTREYKSEGVNINPLTSPRNYKTPSISVTKDTAQMADFYNTPDSAYPTKD